MVSPEVRYQLRSNQLVTLIMRLNAQDKFEEAAVLVESARRQFETDWKHRKNDWHVTRRNNPEVVQMLQRGAKHPSSSKVSASSRSLRLSTRLQRNQDKADRDEALLYCDMKLESISLTLNEMRLFKERNLQSRIIRRLVGARNGRDNPPEDREKRQVKYTIRQHAQIASLPAGTFEHLNALRKVGWTYSRQVVHLRQTTALTQSEIEEIVWKQYQRDQGKMPPQRQKQYDAGDFRRIFDLLKKDDARGWQEIQVWSREERAAFDAWLDKYMSSRHDQKAEEKSLASNDKTIRPLWSRLKRNLSQKHRASGAKRHSSSRSHKRGREGSLLLD